MVVGSAGYPGAALLVASAALRTGIGMARLVSVDAVAELMLAARPEVVRGSVADRCDAWVLGCGVAVEPASAEASWIAAVSSSVAAPIVVDAGAPTATGDGNFARDTSARLPNPRRAGHTVLVARNYLT